jgi:CheY-like chemotaxis protein
MKATQLLVQKVPGRISDSSVTNPKKVAIVDDTPDILLFYSLALRQAGHEVVFSSASGEEVVTEIHRRIE